MKLRTLDLSLQRCFNHLAREAVARCPSCGQYYCRECITEHEDRIICAACLLKLSHIPLTRRRGFVGLRRSVQCLLGLLLTWFFFYLLGESLLALPTSFHEGTLWQVHWFENQ
jgi:hypothetical protein